MTFIDRRHFIRLAAVAAALAMPFADGLQVQAAEPPKKPVPPPSANDAKPEEIVKNLYDRYAAESFDYMEDTLRPHYFSKALDGLLAKAYEKSNKSDEPGIDYEPLIDGQDGDVKNLTIVVTATAPAKVTVEARFTNFEDKTVVSFDFVQEKGSWKIDDIRGKDGNSLKTIARDYLQ